MPWDSRTGDLYHYVKEILIHRIEVMYLYGKLILPEERIEERDALFL